MTVFHHSEPGGKEVNEDSFLTCLHPMEQPHWICCIADGQGGRPNGAEASITACEATVRLLSAENSLSDLGSLCVMTIAEEVDRLVSATGGFTTLVVVVACPGGLTGVSSGDSKVYFRDENKAVVELTERQQKNPPVGSGDARFEPFAVRCSKGSRVLMMTDGVWKYAGYGNILAAFELASFKSATAGLQFAVASRSPGGLPDDFTLVGIEF